MKSPIDFTLLCDRTEGYAVHCSTKEEADLFYQWACRLYPNYCTSWSYGSNRWHEHGEDTIYTFDGGSVPNWQKRGLLFGKKQTAIDIGYTVIEFEEICKQAKVVESDMSLDFLLT